MPVNTARDDYSAFIEMWARLRDCFNGRDAVLGAGNAYVPDLPGLDHVQNKAYRARGNFYNAVSRTVFGLVGAVFQKEPVFEVPPEFENYLDDITLTNVTMQMFALEASHETMLVGRYGVLVDMAMAPAEEYRPYFVAYKAEDIVNWRTSKVGGDEILALVVLRETVEADDPDDSFILKKIIQYRECRLVNGMYIQQLWRKKPNTEDFIQFGPPAIPQRRGVPLDYIPFVFFGSTHITPELGQPPLLDLADVNLAHWRNSVDHEYGLHLVALPTPWMAGAKASPDGKLKIGPSTVWELDVNGSAGMLEFTGNGMKAILEAMEEKKKEMATLGARMLEAQQKLNETATAVLVRHSSDYANLRTVAQTMEQGFTMLLQTMVWWMTPEAADDPKDVSIKVELNKEFMNTKIDAQTVATALTALQAGRMSFKTFYSILTTGGWTREGVDVDEELADIGETKPTPIVQPVAKPGVV